LLTVTRERRFSYYRIASPLVAAMLESLKVVAAIEVPPRRQPRSANEEALRFARSCYDHLAGQIGVTHFRFSMILGRPSCLQLAVRPEGADYQWRKIPLGELSIDPVADERLVRATARAGAS